MKMTEKQLKKEFLEYKKARIKEELQDREEFDREFDSLERLQKKAKNRDK